MYKDLNVKIQPWNNRKFMVVVAGNKSGNFEILNKIDKLFRRLANKNVKSILITLGGTDIRNLMPRLLKSFSFNNIKKKLVIGNGFNNVGDILGNINSNTELVFNPDAKRMRQLMEEADLAISSAGQTLFELARTGVPTIMIGTADNQTININFFQKEGFYLAGWWNSPGLLNNISNHFEMMKNFHIRKDISEKIQKLIDGQGVNKVVESICKYGFF